MSIPVLAILGFLISIYSLYVKRRLRVKGYKPLCDLHKHVSCSTAFSSTYSELVVLPNMIWGLLFYSAVFFFYEIGWIQILFWMALFATLGSIYLAYISYWKQKNFCLICTSIYVINALILWSIWSW